MVAKVVKHLGYFHLVHDRCLLIAPNARGSLEALKDARKCVVDLGPLPKQSAKVHLKASTSNARDAGKRCNDAKRARRQPTRCGCSLELALRLQEPFTTNDKETPLENEEDWMEIMVYEDLD